MAKVREVLAQIGNTPLIDELEARGFMVLQGGDKGETEMADALKDLGYGVFGDDDYEAVVRYAREVHSAPIMDEDISLSEGFELYRSRKTEEFRLWLRALFWNGLGRIV